MLHLSVPVQDQFAVWIVRGLSTLRAASGLSGIARLKPLRETLSFVGKALSCAVAFDERDQERVCLKVLGWLQEDIETLTRSAA